MNLGKINLITPPDRLYNSNVSYLLVQPSAKIKIQFQQTLSQMNEDVNVYVFDETESDIDWLLCTSQLVDFVIIDIDNCNYNTKLFIGLILSQSNAHYMTTDDATPWRLISRNRIYNLDWITDILNKDEDDDA